MKQWVKKVHFVGIGGIGMSGIAEVLLNLGFEVSGSDLAEGANTKRLRELGGQVVIGHDGKNLGAADVVVVSSAARADNPEVVAARYRGVPVIPRAEMLAELMRMKRGIAVAGSHGKTTTTSMIAAILSKAGMDPTAIIGGRLNIFNGSNAKLGQGEWIVAEADESDGSFLHLDPTVVVVTNVDREHMDHYHDLQTLHDTFVEFMNHTPFYGMVVVGIDDPVARSLVPRVKRRVVTYGEADDAEIRAVEIAPEGVGCRFTAARKGERLGEVSLGMPGRHNAANALAALAVAFELGIGFPEAARALHRFGGVGRRFEVKGEFGGVMIVDDYGHHPTEIKATLRAGRETLKNAGRPAEARLVVVFQPHRYSRAQDLWAEFGQAFFDADLLVTTEIYAASEDPIPGVSGHALSEEIAARRSERGLPTLFIPALDEIAPRLLAELRPGDIFITLGAGPVNRVGQRLAELLEAKP